MVMNISIKGMSGPFTRFDKHGRQVMVYFDKKKNQYWTNDLGAGKYLTKQDMAKLREDRCVPITMNSITEDFERLSGHQLDEGKGASFVLDYLGRSKGQWVSLSDMSNEFSRKNPRVHFGSLQRAAETLAKRKKITHRVGDRGDEYRLENVELSETKVHGKKGALPSESELVDYLKKAKSISTDELHYSFNVSSQQARGFLQKLVTKGTLKKAKAPSGKLVYQLEAQQAPAGFEDYVPPDQRQHRITLVGEDVPGFETPFATWSWLQEGDAPLQEFAGSGEDGQPSRRDIEQAFNSFMSQHVKKVVKDPVGFSKGKKYWRIYREVGSKANPSKSAYGFFNPATGDLLKADGWKRPAKGVRGNVLEPNTWKRANEYSIT